MGYYTSFHLDVYQHDDWIGERKDFQAIPDDICDELEKEIDRIGVFEDGNILDGYWGYAKWYRSDEDMLKLSTKFPDLLFILHGDGEDSEDLWNTYYHNGASQHAQALITYDDYDPKKLVPCKDLSVLNPDTTYSYGG